MESRAEPPHPAVLPPKLKPGDRVRFVSPASTPDPLDVMRQVGILQEWGFVVDFGDHVYDKLGYLAGSDEDRLADLNAAFRDPDIRAIFATRGGKGSYRIADRIDFDAVRRDPKPLVGFSDITILHLTLWQRCRLIGIGGGLLGDTADRDALRAMLTGCDDVVIDADPEETTATLTTSGRAEGRLIGGNLDMLITAAGWALPSLRGAILFIEAVNMQRGQLDRGLTMLRKAGHLDGVAGIAIGQFVGFDLSLRVNAIDILRDHLASLDAPILGGLPVGHGARHRAILHGAEATLDTQTRRLTIRQG